MLTPIYLDHNATTPVDASVRAKVPEWLDLPGNPSSIHWAGRAPKALVRESRRAVAEAIGSDPLEVIFTSGGSEANNLALDSACAGLAGERDRIVISGVEHPSLAKKAEALVRRGYFVDVIPVNREGHFDREHFARVLGPRTRLVSVMFANNETGTILPVKEMAAHARSAGALVHCDAVQALGKVPIDVRDLGVDYLSLSAHKFYALKGCGVLFVRRGAPLERQIHGGNQERGRRAGTENVVGIASLGLMAARASEIEVRAKDLARMRDHLENRVITEIEGVLKTGAGAPRLPNTSSLILDGVDGETLLMNLDVRGFAVSTGAACSSGSPEPSPTLLAMGLTRAEAQSSLRVSLGWGNTRAEIDRFVDELKLVVARLRGFKHGEAHAYGV